MSQLLLTAYNRRLLLTLVLSWVLPLAQATEQGGSVIESRVVDVLHNYAEQLMRLPGVVAVGQGECDGLPCIKVYAAVSSPELLAQLPKKIEGVTVALEISGPIEAR